MIEVSASQIAGEINVVASFSILGDMVEQVAGDKANVTTIVGPDADAHVFNSAKCRVAALLWLTLILIITNGMGFEAWSATLIESSGTKAKIAVATDGIAPLLVDGEIDPHAWKFAFEMA